MCLNGQLVHFIFGIFHNLFCNFLEFERLHIISINGIIEESNKIHALKIANFACTLINDLI